MRNNVLSWPDLPTLYGGFFDILRCHCLPHLCSLAYYLQRDTPCFRLLYIASKSLWPIKGGATDHANETKPSLIGHRFISTMPQIINTMSIALELIHVTEWEDCKMKRITKWTFAPKKIKLYGLWNRTILYQFWDTLFLNSDFVNINSIPRNPINCIVTLQYYNEILA